MLSICIVEGKDLEGKWHLGRNNMCSWKSNRVPLNIIEEKKSVEPLVEGKNQLF